MDKKNIIDKIGFFVIIVTIIMLNMFIGSNIKEPIWIIQAIVSAFTAIYLIIKKIQKTKNVVIKRKIDIAVLVFMISTTIPLIFNTYVSLEGTINFILKYWSIYGLYILVNNIVIGDNKKINIVVNTLIFSSVIVIIFGFDKFTFNIFTKIYEILNSVNIEDTRMISTFGYANTLAAYLSFVIVLAIGQFVKNKDNIKNRIIYGIYILLAIITIILTQSKMVLAIDALIILLFIIFQIKNKKISKKWIFVGIIGIELFFIYFLIAINIDKPLVVTDEEKTCVIRGIESNTDYNLYFNIDANTDKTYDVFKIKIVEVNRYFTEKVLARFNLGDFTGTKSLNIHTGDLVDHIEIRIENELNQEITINDFRINGKKYILEYKIIPEPLVRVFTTFNFKNSSVWQRADFWQDSLDIIKDNWVFGAGGNAWRMLYGQVQDYLYYAKEAHSYILEVWMSFGIVGIASYIIIIILTIKSVINIFKKQDKKNNNILIIAIGLSIILIHSCMDFDMSYLIIEMIVFMFIAILNKDETEFKSDLKIIDIIISIAFLAIGIGNVLGFVADKINDENMYYGNKLASWVSKYNYNEIIYYENNNIQDEDKIKKIKKFIKEEPYLYQNIMYEIMSNQIIKDFNNGNIDRAKTNIDYLINVLNNVKVERIYEIESIQKRSEILLNLSQSLDTLYKETQDDYYKSTMEKVIDIIKKDYEKYRYKAYDFEKSQFDELITQYKIEFYDRTYNDALNLLGS